MSRYIIRCLVFLFLITGSACTEEPEMPESTIGHLRINVAFPEVVYDEDGLLDGFKPVPGEGAVARLYSKDAKCHGYKNAVFGIAHTGETPVQARYYWSSNKKGEIFFDNIQAGKYYLVIVAREFNKYTEKYIEVTVGDTLVLSKYFTSVYISMDLEPWDFEEPNPS